MSGFDPKQTLSVVSAASNLRSMRRVILLAAALFVSGAAQRKVEPIRFELWFGATPSSPIAAPEPCLHPRPGHELCPRLLPDYIANSETVVPQVIRSCGASFVSFEVMTDGKEGALFDVDPDDSSAVRGCIKRQLPQGSVQDTAQRFDVNKPQVDPLLQRH
jgi:hypothetical protein